MMDGVTDDMQMCKHDLTEYVSALIRNDKNQWEAIERKYGLQGRRPQEVCAGLSAGVEGRSIDDATLRFIYT